MFQPDNFRRTLRLPGLALVPVLLAAPAYGQGLEERVRKLERQLDQVERSAEAEERAYAKWHLAGYADAGYTATTEDGATDSFNVGSFNPSFHFQYRDFLLFESELEIELEEDGATETALEYAQLNLLAHDYLTVVLGKFLSPIGQFQERLHPSWINKLPSAPAGFGHGGAQPLSEVGAQVRGGAPAGGMTVTYALFAGNGPRLGHHGPELEGFPGDDNDDKAFGGRLGLLPVPQVEAGVSFLRAGELVPETGPGGPTAETSDGYRLWGADFAFTGGAWDLRGEYLASTLEAFVGQGAHGEDNVAVPETDWTAWYLQVARRFGPWEPVVRYGELEADGFAGFEGDNEERATLGLNYLLAANVIAKLAWEDRGFDEPARDDHQRYQLQLAYGF